MTKSELIKLKNWFKSYTGTFLALETIEFPVRLKIGHSARVAANMDQLTEELSLPSGVRRTAEAIAWLHDAGRFPQLREYGTLNDRESENHALLSVKVIEEEGVVDNQPVSVQEVIKTAVANHNRIEIEPGLDDRSLLFCRLIRDADKIDIERVIRMTDEGGGVAERDSVFLELPEEPVTSPEIVADILSHRIARMENMRVCNDFRLVALSWVFDINFKPSFRMLKQGGHLDYLIGRLPEDARTRQAVESVLKTIEAGTSK